MRFVAGRFASVLLLTCVLGIGLACSKAPDDSQLTTQIQSKLNEDSGLQGKAITVETSGGVVTLSGTVDNETQRAAAARYGSTIPGVKQVVNNLQATTGGATHAADQAARLIPVPEKASAKPRPSKPLRRTEKDTREMAASAPSEVADNAKADENPAPAPPAEIGPPPPPPPSVPKKVTVPVGTSVAIRLLDPIDSETAQPGQTFRATLDAPLPTDGDEVPSGYGVKGHVEDVKSAGKFKGQSLLILELDSMSVSGRSYLIDAAPYRRQGSNRTTNTAEKVGAGAVLGAIIGGIAGGGKGAGIGAAAGGGLGGGVQAATKGQQIKLPPETMLNFTLTQPLTVTLPDRAPNSHRPKLDAPQQ
jgi:hypothetical protein